MTSYFSPLVSLADLLNLKLIVAVNPLGESGGGGPIQILLPGLLSGYKVSGAPVTTAEESQSHSERWQLCLFDASIPTSCFQQTPVRELHKARTCPNPRPQLSWQAYGELMNRTGYQLGLQEVQAGKQTQCLWATARLPALAPSRPLENLHFVCFVRM